MFMQIASHLLDCNIFCSVLMETYTSVNSINRDCIMQLNYVTLYIILVIYEPRLFNFMRTVLIFFMYTTIYV